MWRLCEKSMDTSQVCSNDIEINQQFRRLLAPVQLLDSLIGGFELEVIAIAISLLLLFFFIKPNVLQNVTIDALFTSCLDL